MRKLFIISVISLISISLIKAQEKPHFYVQGEIGPSINKTHTEILSGREFILGYNEGSDIHFGIECDIESGIKNNSLMAALGTHLFYPEGTGDFFASEVFAPFVKFGCNYFKNKNFFLGNYIALGFFYQKHNIVVNHQVEQAFFFYPHIKTGLYFLKKSLVISLNIHEYLRNSDYGKYNVVYPSKYTGYIFNILALNLEIGYRFDFGKHNKVTQ